MYFAYLFQSRIIGGKAINLLIIIVIIIINRLIGGGGGGGGLDGVEKIV